MDDIGKKFREFQRKVEENLKNFPIIAANEAKNFFLDSFRKQAWIGETTEAWPQRKPNKKRAGAAILVKTGNLKRSIRIKQANWQNIVISTNVPYAAVHNDGFRGTYERTASRRAKIKGSYKRVGDERKKAKKMTVMGATHQVHQNIPRRRFMGESPFLDNKIDRQFILQLSKIK